MDTPHGSSTAKTVLWVAYAYEASGVVERRRTPETAFVREVFPIEIQALPRQAAPTALILEDADRPAQPRRAAGGRLWRAVPGPRGSDAPIAIDDLPGLLSGEDPAAATWSENPFRNMMLPTPLAPSQCRTIEAMRFRTVLSSGRARALQDLSKLAEQTRLIDGQLYRAAPEPTFVVTREPDNRAISIDLCDGPWPRRDGPSAIFRGDRHDQARIFAMRLAQALRQPEICDAGNVRLVAPDAYAFSLDEVSATTRQCCLSMLEQGFGTGAGVEWLSVEQFLSWTLFRDAAARFLRRRGSTPHEALQALIDLVETLPRDERHPAAKFSHIVRSRASLPLLLARDRAIASVVELDDDLAAIEGFALG